MTKINFYRTICSENRFIKVVKDANKKTARVILNRPPVNALNIEIIQQLIDSIKHLEDKKFRGIILQSSLQSTFCAGLDLSKLYRTSENNIKDSLLAFQNLWKTLYTSPLITVAAINGHAPAGGCILTLGCDYRIMLKSKSRIGISAVLMGFSPPKWAMCALRNTIGVRKADDAILTGKLFTPEEALAVGLVDQLADTSECLEKKTEEEMNLRLNIPEAAMKMAKQHLHQATFESFESFEKQDLEETVKTVLFDEVQKTIGIHLEKLQKKT